MNHTSHRRRLSVRGITLAAATAVALIGGAAVATADDGGPTTTQGSVTSAAPAPPSGTDAAPDTGIGAPTPPAHLPHLDGTVTSVDSGAITITDPEGFTRTIHLVSDTTYGDGVSLPIQVGERIHAEGSVDTDGTSLAATVISAAPQPPLPGSAGPDGDSGPAGPPAPPTDGTMPTPPAPPTDGGLPVPPGGADPTASTLTAAPTAEPTS